MLGGWALLILNPLAVKGMSIFRVKVFGVFYFLDICGIIPNNKDPLKVCNLRRLKWLGF